MKTMKTVFYFFWAIVFATAIGLAFIACEGPAGPRGGAGIDVPGETPFIGPNGNWWIGTTDTGVRAHAAIGRHPHIGENGNWWIGIADTGITAQGVPRVVDGYWWIGTVNTDIAEYGSPPPHVGTNGTWWIYTSDTDIPAQGAIPRVVYDYWWIGTVDTGISASWKIRELEIAFLPGRTVFYIGDDIDSEGLQVNIIYSDGLIRRITTDCFTVTYPSTYEAGLLFVTVALNINYTITASFSVRVVRHPPNISASHGSGVFGQPFYLTLSAPGGFAIYYSIDGSIPLPENVGNGRVFRYTGPIPVVCRNYPVQPNLLATPENSVQFYNYPNDPRGFQPVFIPRDEDVRKATVIRAVAVNSAGNKSDVITRTFFIGDNLRNYGNHPIISIVTDPFNLVDETYGIYVRGHEDNRWNASASPTGTMYNFRQRGREFWERPAFLEILDGNSGQRNVSLSTGVGIRIAGGWSRAQGQKSFNVFFRSEYGIHTLTNFDLVPGAVQADGHPLTTWRSFRLRNGGNCTRTTKLYDAFIQSLLTDRNFSTLASIPAIVYLNGEYWGPYNLRERFSDHHIGFVYGVNRNNVIVWENGEIDEGTATEGAQFIAMMTRLRGLDMSIQENFEQFLGYFDKQSFIDYFAAQIYVDNQDWPHNNYRLWRVRHPEPGNPFGDGRWRWQMTDTDLSLGRRQSATQNQNPIGRLLVGGTRSNNRNAMLFRALLENEEFSSQFVITMMDLYNVNFHPYFSIPKLDEMAAIYRPLMEGYFERWEGGRRTISQHFDPYINRARSFLRDVRLLMTQTYLPTYFAHLGITAGNLFNVTLSTNNAPNASITINTVTPNLASGSWTGRYYAPLGVTVTANVPGGREFTGWVVEGGTAETPNALTTAIEFNGNVRITANFR